MKIKRMFFVSTVMLFVNVAVLCYVLSVSFRASQEHRDYMSPRARVTVQAINRVKNSVVNLSARFQYSPSDDVSGAEQSIGSGCVIDSRGLVLTNAHVVHNAAQIDITMNSGAVYRGQLLVEDTDNDIAVLRILADGATFLPIPLAPVNDIEVGENVIAVGNPFGLDGTMTRGIISGLGRSFYDQGKTVFSDLIQTDAAVFPGNSGGPLINLAGEMLGMNTAVKRNTLGIGFAIPLLRIENILGAFLIPERIRNLNLGLTPRIAPNGEIVIAQVLPDSPAERAGLRAGKIVMSVNGHNPTGNMLIFSRELIGLRAGVPLKLVLKGSPFPVILRAEPLVSGDGVSLAYAKLGLGIQSLTKNLAKALEYPVESGVVVDHVPPNLPGVRRGDLLIRLGRRIIHDTSDVAKVLADPIYSKEVPAVFITKSEGRYGGKEFFRQTFQLPVK